MTSLASGFESFKMQLSDSWLLQLEKEFEAPYMLGLYQFLMTEKKAEKCIYPDSQLWFNAFNITPFDKVKVVILGQDPYHGSGQAHGLCFSVLPGVRIPPSLQNVFKELQSDLGIAPATHGCLQSWAEQGVLLLNATLTVEQAKAGSHQGKGWEQFTDKVIEQLNQQRQGIVFVLWGSYAQKKGEFIDAKKHVVLQASHPSPLSAYRGFLGCGHFSKINAYLRQKRQKEINWALPDSP